MQNCTKLRSNRGFLDRRQNSVRDTATDAGSQPVTDLTAADFKVVDNGVAEKDIVIRAAERGTQFTLVLLFDLLNSSMQERGYMRQQLHSLLSPPPTGALALYLLDASGKLYPVGAPASGRDHADAIQALSLQAGALLDRALEKAPLTGPADLKNRVVRTKVTYRALDDLCSAIKPIPGKKRVRWIT